MESRDVKQSLPRGSEVFVFGSFLRHKDPNDVDILIVYDPEICPPKDAHASVAGAVHTLEKGLALPVHLTLLTKTEESTCDFKREVGCVPLEHALRLRETLVPTGPLSATATI
jgi:predicted nucleotidyltransferase